MIRRVMQALSLLYIMADSQVLVGCLEGSLDELHVFVWKLQRRLTSTFARRLTSFYPGTASSRTGSAKRTQMFLHTSEAFTDD